MQKNATFDLSKASTMFFISACTFLLITICFQRCTVSTKVKLLAGDYITITCNEGTLYIFRSSTSGASLKTERLQDQASSTSSRIYTQCRQFKRKNIFDEFSSVESPIRIIVCRTGTVFFEDTEQDGLQAEFGTMLDHKPFTQGTRCQFWPNPL